VSWEDAQRITPEEAAVVTGATAEEQPVQQVLKIDKPLFVWVTDGAGSEEEFDKLEEVVFKKENVALGLKAFRTVRMTAADAEKEPLLAGKGSEVPRILLVDASKKVTTLEKNKLSCGGVFTAMKKTASSFYEQDLDALVKDHLKLLTDLDKAAAQDKTLAEKEERLTAEGAKGKKDLAEVQKEREEIRARLDTLREKQAQIWKLTAKVAKAA
jgi:hypothetical protein